MKYCPGCKLDRPEGEFYPEPKRRGGGLSSECKDCRRGRMRRYWRDVYYPAHREAQIAAVQERRRERRQEQDAALEAGYRRMAALGDAMEILAAEREMPEGPGEIP